MDVGNAATNVIPGEARAAFNIRFNDKHTPESLIGWVKDRADAHRQGNRLPHRRSAIQVSGVSFLTAAGQIHPAGQRHGGRVTGQAPVFSTSGGTSDARFIKDHCPVVELGLAGATMHKTDECVGLSEIRSLTDIYAPLLTDYFAKPLV